jgi:hypothetical protein
MIPREIFPRPVLTVYDWDEAFTSLSIRKIPIADHGLSHSDNVE